MSSTIPPALADASLIARTTGMIDAEIGGELVGLHVESGHCYGFNPTATRIWALIEQPMTFGALRAALLDEFDVDPETCRRDATTLIDDLVRERLVIITPAA